MSVVVANRIEELEDYAELSGLLEPELIPPPELSRCFVHRAEGGEIDGYVFIQTVCVIEPIWVADNKRGTGVGPRLFGEAITALRTEGQAKHYICHALAPDIEGYLKRLGLKDVGRTFIGEVV